MYYEPGNIILESEDVLREVVSLLQIITSVA